MKCSQREEKSEPKMKGKAKALRVKQEPGTQIQQHKQAPVNPLNAPTSPTVLIPSQHERDHHSKVEEQLQEIIRLYSSLDRRLQGLEKLSPAVHDLQRHITVLIESTERDRHSSSSAEFSMLAETLSQSTPDWTNIRTESKPKAALVSSEPTGSEGGLTLGDKLATLRVVEIPRETIKGSTGESSSSAEDGASSGEGLLSGEHSTEGENPDEDEEDPVELAKDNSAVMDGVE